ncbi:MAG: AT hook domain-containing protein [Merdibacter sp.]
MYKQMLSGDEIIERPKGTTGFGSHLTIRFYVDTLEGREPLHPQKKRGRPAKSEEEKAAARKAKLKHSTQDLCSLLKSWLGEHGWEYVEEGHHRCTVDKRWIINVQGIKRGRKQPLPIKLSEILTQMEDASADYSMAFNDSITYRRQWQEIPQSVKERLHMSVILADKKGNIVKI